MAGQNYEVLVKQAEQAVASVKDPELKRIAFGKILDSLIGTSDAGRETEFETTTNTKRRSHKTKRTGTKASKPRTGNQSYVEELVDDGFFNERQTIAAVKAELANRGHHIPITSVLRHADGQL
jgi:predicted transcriptional regulator YheO